MKYSSLFAEHGLSLDRLRSFLDVVEEGSIVKAAGGDVNRQSQYSRQIKELEEFFGAELTRRKGRRIEITEEGERLARLIRGSFMGLSDFRAESKHEPRRAVVAAGASVIEWLLAPVFAECRRVLGESVIETRSMRSGDVVRALDDGRVDFGILREDAVTPALESVAVGSVDYMLFIPVNLIPGTKPRSAAGWSKVLPELPQARLVEGGRLRQVVDSAHQALMIRPPIVAETTSLLQLAALVKSGECAAVLPQTAASVLPVSEVVAWPLSGFLDYRRTLRLVFRKSALERRGWGGEQVDALSKALRKGL